MENPIEMDDLRGPLFSETPICESVGWIYQGSGCLATDLCWGHTGLPESGPRSDNAQHNYPIDLEVKGKCGMKHESNKSEVDIK